MTTDALRGGCSTEKYRHGMIRDRIHTLDTRNPRLTNSQIKKSGHRAGQKHYSEVTKRTIISNRCKRHHI